MSKQKITTILYDYDGTLFDTLEIIMASWQHAYKHYFGKEMPREHIEKTFGEPLVRTIQRDFPNEDVQEVIEVYRSVANTKFGELITVFPGMSEVIKVLHSKGYKQGIVTSRIRFSTVLGLDQFDLSQYMDGIICADDTTKHKPDPEPILLALDKLGARPEEAVIIGDSPYDINGGKNAGIKTALVSWALLDDEEKQALKPDYLIQEAKDILEIIL